jgi:hypothetical protein
MSPLVYFPFYMIAIPAFIKGIPTLEYHWITEMDTHKTHAHRRKRKRERERTANRDRETK